MPLLALGTSVVLHAVGMAGWAWHGPAPSSAPGTVSVFSVRLAPQAAGEPAKSPVTPAERTAPALAPVQPRPPQARSRPAPSAPAAPAAPSQPAPELRTAAAAPAPPASLPDNGASPAEPPPPAAMASLFGPLTQQPLGRGGWGQGQRRQQAEATAVAMQAQQPQMLQALVHARLAAMGEVMRQSQQVLECDIRLDTHTRHAEVSCQPEPMRSAAWGALQGLATPGPLEATAEPLLSCLRWTAFEVLTLPCRAPLPADPLDR